MSGRVAWWVAWSVCGLTLVLIACAIALAALNHYELWGLTFLVAQATAALVGGMVASRRPANPVGWLVAGHALCFTLGEFTRQYAIYGLLTDPGSLPAAKAMASPPYWIWFPGLMLVFSFLPLYFPDGRLVSRRWRPVVWVALFATVAMATFAAFQPGTYETLSIPNPLGIEVEGLTPLAGVFGVAIPALWLALGIASVTSLVVRFLRSRGEERQQIKWFVYAMVLVVAFTLADVVSAQDLPAAFAVLGNVVFTSPFVAIGVAVLRYRLYDVDLIINRTLVYGSITAMLVLTYLGTVVLLQGAFRSLTGEGSQLAVVASTLAIAALFGPLRRRIQAFIDRCFYRRKYDAAKTLETFNATLRDEVELDVLTGRLVGVVRETMQPEHASLWLRPLGRRR